MSSITSITGLQNLTDLRNFYADYNSLSSVNLSGITSLEEVNLSRCKIPGTNDPSLTAVNTTGCTSLVQLFIDHSNFSAGIPNITGASILRYLDLNSSGMTGALDFTGFSSALEGINLYNNPDITSVDIPQSITYLNLAGNNLSESAVDSILALLNAYNQYNGSVDISGGTNAAPSVNGIQLKQTLENKGWSVSINQAPPAFATIAASSDFDITGDYTIEMFVNMSNLNGFQRPYSFGAYPAPNAMSIEGGQLYFWANGTPLMSASFNPTLGQWYHICVMRSVDANYMFINGVQVATATYPGNISSQNLPLTIGNGNEPNSAFNGLMSNFRWTAHSMYNPAGFSVPSQPLGLMTQGLTKLLLFQGSDLTAQLVDNSGHGHNATSSGTTFSPIDPFDSVEGSLQMGN